MIEKFKEQIGAYAQRALGDLDESIKDGEKATLEALLTLSHPFNPLTVEEIPEAEDILAYASVQMDAKINYGFAVLTNRALYLTGLAVFSGKVKYRERIADSSVTGVEVLIGSGMTTGVQTMTINRTSEKDEIRFYFEYATTLVRKTIDGWIEAKQTSVASTQESPTDTLMKLKGLLDAGVISQEEFDDKKNELMGRI